MKNGRKAKTPAGSWRYPEKSEILAEEHYMCGVKICQEKKAGRLGGQPWRMGWDGMGLVLEDGAGLGDVGVEVFDHVVELLLDYAAAEF